VKKLQGRNRKQIDAVTCSTLRIYILQLATWSLAIVWMWISTHFTSFYKFLSFFFLSPLNCAVSTHTRFTFPKLAILHNIVIWFDCSAHVSRQKFSHIHIWTLDNNVMLHYCKSLWCWKAGCIKYFFSYGHVFTVPEIVCKIC